MKTNTVTHEYRSSHGWLEIWFLFITYQPYLISEKFSTFVTYEQLSLPET